MKLDRLTAYVVCLARGHMGQKDSDRYCICNICQRCGTQFETCIYHRWGKP